MTVILLDGGIGSEINVLTSNFILLGGNYRPKWPTAMQSSSIFPIFLVPQFYFHVYYFEKIKIERRFWMNSDQTIFIQPLSI